MPDLDVGQKMRKTAIILALLACYPAMGSSLKTEIPDLSYDPNGQSDIPTVTRFSSIEKIKEWAFQSSPGGYRISETKDKKITIIFRSMTSGIHSGDANIFKKEHGAWTRIIYYGYISGAHYTAEEDGRVLKIYKESSTKKTQLSIIDLDAT